MSERDLSYAGWLARRRRNAARRARLEGALSPLRRQHLRPAAEARFLRQVGTPELLIGPVGTDEEVARERADLVAFARRLRQAASRP